MPYSFVVSLTRLACRSILSIVFCTLLTAAATQQLLAATATTTALTVSLTALAPGEAAKLVATVADAAHTSFPGTVQFYDGSRLLGSAQVVTHPTGSFALGTATLSTDSFNAGSNSITAVFAGTKSYLSSTSSAETVTVTGKYETVTSLASSGASGSYDLTATLGVFGTAPPSGKVQFFNDTTGASLGLLSLTGGTSSAELFGTNIGVTAPFLGFKGFTVGDLNGDGLLDLVSVNNTNVNIYLQKSDGTFSTSVIVTSAAYGYVSPSIGDFNSDGIPDLAIPGPSGLTLFLGNGDGTFQAPTTVDPDCSVRCVSGAFDGLVADFDQDGNLDVIFVGDDSGNNGNGGICVLRGNGDGTFKAPQFLGFDNTPDQYVLAEGDLNGDGIPDVMVATGSGTEYVLIGNGDGTFHLTPSDPLSIGSGPIYIGLGPWVTLGDLNGDGILDVVLSNPRTDTIFVALGKGDGTFGPQTSYQVGLYPCTVVIMDQNGDGKLDLVVASSGGDTESIDVLPGNGDGTFQPAAVYPSNVSLSGVLVPGDFNGDGLTDLASSNFSYTDLAVILNARTSNVELSGVPLSGSGTSAVYATYLGDANYNPSTSCDESPGVKPESPKLDGIYSDHITSTTASVGWTSSFPTNGYVRYGTTSPLSESTPFEHDATAFHFVDLTGLAPGTTYSYTVTSIAYFAGCNHWTTTSQVFSFTTAAQ